MKQKMQLRKGEQGKAYEETYCTLPFLECHGYLKAPTSKRLNM